MTELGKGRVRSGLRTCFFQSAIINRESDATMLEVAKVVCEWIALRSSNALPPHAFLAEDFEADSTDLTFAVRHESAWAVRFRHPDPHVGGRIWTTDIALQEIRNDLLFHCRVTFSGSKDDTDIYSVPRIVSDIAERFGFDSDLSVSKTATYESDVDTLKSYLESSSRRMPVVIVSDFDIDQVHPLQRNTDVLSTCLSEKLYCLAHVFRFTNDTSDRWTELVGKEWSVFRGGIRVYLPGLSFEDIPYRHRLFIGSYVHRFQEQSELQHLAGKLFAECIRFHISSTDVSVENVFAMALRAKKYDALRRFRESTYEEAVSEIEELRFSYDGLADHLVTVCEERDENFELLEEALRHEADAKADAEHMRSVISGLKAKIEALEHALESSRGQSESITPLPLGYGQLADWCHREFPGKVFVHQRAVRALKDAVFGDFDLVVNAIRLLANEYRRFALGLPNAKSEFEDKLRDLSLEYAKSATETSAGREGDTYFVNYPRSGQRRFLEWHLRKGKSRDKSLCLRIYFFFDSDDELVVIGWLPSHLDNSVT